MRKHPPPDQPTPYSGSRRHYHRAGAPQQRTWDDWVEGGAAKKRSWPRRLRIAGIILAVLALAGIVAGLVIELR